MQAYKEVYAKSTPPADWDELLANAPVNERGEKEIPFDDYEVEQEVFDEIFERYTKRMREWDKRTFRFNFYLGATPRTKRKD
jgi:hypothetical protein